MRSFRYIPFVIALMCLVSLFFLQTWQVEDSVYLDQPIHGLGAQKGDSWLPTATKWNSTSDYFMSNHTTTNNGNYVTSQSSKTQFHPTNTSSSGLYQTSNKSMTQFGSGYDLLPAQHFNVFHHNKNANQSTFSNSIQYHTAQSTGQVNMSKVTAMASQSATTPRRTMQAMSKPITTTAITPAAQIAPLATTTFDANYSINGISNRKSSDPFVGNIGDIPNPIEPGVNPGTELPLGDTPIIYMCLLAFGYIVIVHYRKRNTPTNH